MTLDMTNPASVLKEARDDMAKARMANSWGNGHRGGPGNTGGQNVLCGYISESGTKAVSTYPCHAPIRNYVKANTLWSAFGYRTDKATAEQYLDWLLYRSPWSQTGIVPKLDRDYISAQGFIFQNLDKTPGNLLHNFLIATRMAAEWSKYIEAWKRLVSEGVNENYAFYVLALFWQVTAAGGVQDVWVGHNKATFATMDKYDWPLDTFRASTEYVSNFVYGKTAGMNVQMFYPTCHTTPVNTLWGSKLAAGEGEYIKYLKKEYADFFVTEEFGNSGPYSTKYKLLTITQKNLMALIRQEEINLGLKEAKELAA